MLSAPDFKEKQIILALLSHGEKLSFRNDNIIIKDANGIVKHQSTCYRLFALFIVGHVTITSGLLMRAEKFKYTIVLMSHSLRPYAGWPAKTEGNVLLRKKQYNYDGSELARHLVTNKLLNQLQTLKKIRSKELQLRDAIKHIEDYKKRLEKPDLEMQSILGIEGIAGRVYFQALFKEAGWKTRRPRTKIDMVNTLLDIGYTLLFNFVEALLNLYGFDIYQGVYHQQFYQRKSLVCDLIEPFRPIIDARIRKAFQLSQIKEEDFDIRQGQYKLYGEKARPYLIWLIEILVLHKQDIFMYIQSYYRAFIRDKEIKDYPMFDISQK